MSSKERKNICPQCSHIYYEGSLHAAFFEQRNPFCSQHCHNEMASCLCGYACGYAGCSAVRNACHRCHNEMASHLCAYANGCTGRRAVRKPCYSCHNEMASHLCVYASGCAGRSTARKPCGICGKYSYSGSAGCPSWRWGRLSALLLVVLWV